MLAATAQAWVRERLGLDIVVLRCVLVDEDDTGEESGDAYLFAENLSDQAPLVGSWRDEEAIAALVDERDRTAIRQWFIEQREGSPQALQPWEYPGWFATAVDWIEATLPRRSVWISTPHGRCHRCFGSRPQRVATTSRRHPPSSGMKPP